MAIPMREQVGMGGLIAGSPLIIRVTTVARGSDMPGQGPIGPAGVDGRLISGHRHQWKIEAIEMIAKIKDSGKAGACKLRFIPRAVRQLGLMR